MNGLADFVLTIMRDPARLRAGERLGQSTHWPALGNRSPDVTQRMLWPGALLRVRGAGIMRVQGDAGAWVQTVDSEHRALLDHAVSDWLSKGTFDPDGLGGRFLALLWNETRREIRCYTDAFRTFPMAWIEAGGESGDFFAASDLRLLRLAHDLHRDTATAQAPLAIDLQAVYHYLNFSFVPNESCIWSGINKLAPGSVLVRMQGRVREALWWDARYPADLAGSDDGLAQALRDRIVTAVRAYGTADPALWGTFLSGGTDSSSITGILAAQLRERNGGSVNSFSIGFAEPGYDELGFAHIARDAFGLKAFEQSVSEDDAVDLVPRLVSAYDEPFGNASAIPTFYCAALGQANGVRQLIGGDGGDEIFGGNERYLKDRIFSMYHAAPAPVRLLGRLLAGVLGPLDSRWPNKARNFVRRATLPNPDRFYTDDAFASEQFDTLPGPALRHAVLKDDSLDLQRSLYARCKADSELHRLMYLDLKMTIAANDIVKVTRAARLAGVDVAFPFLDPELVGYTGRLPERFKLRGTDKRFLFKRAMGEVLPAAILNKRKQGFGLPVSVWMRRPGRFRDLVSDTLMSAQARERGLFEARAVEALLERHQRGAWDHAAELYILMMLELWFRDNATEKA